MNRFSVLFPQGPALIGMLHLGGISREDRLRRALREMDMLTRAGFDGVIVENYFGNTDDVITTIAAIYRAPSPLKIGVNLLGHTSMAVALAKEFPIDFLQIDSVCGHLPPDQDAELADYLAEVRASVPAAILGGVRFKYQPVASGRTEFEDLRLGMQRCDAIVITSERTGQETDSQKISRFRNAVGPDFPLIVGAGLTAANVGDQLIDCQGGIVGSWLKERHVDRRDMVWDHVYTFARAARGSLPEPR